MRITSAGNVGIGTDSPSAKLHLADSASGGNPSFILQDNARSGAAALNYISLTDSLNTNQARIGYLSGLNTELTLQNLVGDTSLVSSSQMKITAGTNTIFENSGSEKMRINSNGNVGIGTTSPGANLDIEDASGVTIDINSSSGDGQFRFQDDGVTKWSVGRDNTQQNFVFSNSSGLSSDNVLTLAHSSGNVGI